MQQKKFGNLTWRFFRSYFHGIIQPLYWKLGISRKRPYHFKFFKGCLPQVLFGPFLNTLPHLFQWIPYQPRKSLSCLSHFVVDTAKRPKKCFVLCSIKAHVLHYYPHIQTNQTLGIFRLDCQLVFLGSFSKLRQVKYVSCQRSSKIITDKRAFFNVLYWPKLKEKSFILLNKASSRWCKFLDFVISHFTRRNTRVNIFYFVFQAL